MSLQDCFISLNQCAVKLLGFAKSVVLKGYATLLYVKVIHSFKKTNVNWIVKGDVRQKTLENITLLSRNQTLHGK